MDNIDGAMQSIQMGISLFSDAIGLANKTAELMPNSKDKEAIERSLIEATKAARLAEAQIANALGYNLCKCTFPPQIMLSNGYKESVHTHIEEFVCPKCNKSSVPPPDAPIKIPRAKGMFDR